MEFATPRSPISRVFFVRPQELMTPIISFGLTRVNSIQHQLGECSADQRVGVVSPLWPGHFAVLAGA